VYTVLESARPNTSGLDLVPAKAALENGASLPSWLSFGPEVLRFSYPDGGPPLPVSITATDHDGRRHTIRVVVQKPR